MRYTIPMMCAFCNAKKTWPNDFPLRDLARCQHCTQKHIIQDTSAAHEVIIGVVLVAAIVIIALVSWWCSL